MLRQVVEDTRQERERIEQARRWVEANEPFILGGEIFWPPDYREATETLARLEWGLDERVAEEYYLACEMEWEKNHKERKEAC